MRTDCPSGIRRSEQGSYSVEAALALTVFTACLMALISVLSIMKAEAEVDAAVHETAMELSQYSYVWGRTEYLKDYADEKLPQLKELMGDGTKGYSDLALTGPTVAKLLMKHNFPRDNVDEWLKRQGVRKGYNGLNFSDTRVLTDGKTIEVAVTYDLDAEAFGFFRKTLHLRSAAVTYGLLPTDSALRAGSGKNDLQEKSIWKESNFVRGRYFANEVRSGKQYGAPVKPGQGIDLYSAATGTYAEVYSVNLFTSTYATAAYDPKVESIEKALFGYAKDLRNDISGLGNSITMADGSSAKPVKAERKVLILIVPEEVKEHEAMNRALTNTASAVRLKEGVTVELRYEQKALAKNGKDRPNQEGAAKAEQSNQNRSGNAS